MQSQEVPPYAEATAFGEHGMGAAEDQRGDQAHKKKSVIGKVKDKAKKLKTKIKKPKSHGETGDNHDNDVESSNPSDSEDESGESEPQQQQLGDQYPGDEREVLITPGLKDTAFEATPDPRANITGEQPHKDAAGVENRFGQLRLGDEPKKLQEEVPSAPGQVSAGVTPYLASHNLGQSPVATGANRAIPVEEGKIVEGKDLLVTPTASESDYKPSPMEFDQPTDVSKTSENVAAWYTPTSSQDAPEGQQDKPLKDRVFEGAAAAKDNVTATAASGAAALGLKSEGQDTANTENVKDKGTDVGGTQKSFLEQAKERVWGSSKKPEDEAADVGQNKSTTTGRAAGTVTGLKDTIASKLGYGSNKNLTGESATTTIDASTATDPQNAENKSALQKIQERAAGATGAITSKLGYGDKQNSADQVVGEEMNLRENTQKATKELSAGENKSYTQKATEAIYGAKDAVAAKLGYGGSTDNVASGTQGDNKPYIQKVQETAAGAKEAVTSKLGYAARDIPSEAVSESAYGHDENVPASTAARFHPGEEDRALSQLITEKMSTGAATVKDTLLKPFGASKSGPSTPTTTPPPSSTAAVTADPEHTTVSGTTATTTTDVPPEEKPGIMGKMTGAVSSLLGTSASGKKKPDEVAGKANEDLQAAGVCNVEMH